MIGENIKKKRLEKNITLKELAESIGVSSPTVQRYESGEISNIKYETITNIAKALNTTPAYILGWEQKEPINENDGLKKDIIDKLNKLTPENYEIAVATLDSLINSLDKKDN